MSAIKSYTDNGQAINAGLANKEVYEEIDLYINSHATEWETLFRGCKMEEVPDVGAEISLGSGYVSTSQSPVCAFIHARTVYDGQEGQKMVVLFIRGAMGASIEEVSLHSEEEEVLLPRGLKFIVESVVKDPDDELYVLEVRKI